MKVTYDDISIEIGKLTLFFPQRQYTPEDLQDLTDGYFEALSEFDADVVTEARKRAQSSERFFPTISTMKDFCALVLAEREHKAQSAYWHEPLPEVSEEKRQRNAVLAHLLRRRLAGDVEAAREMDAMLAAGAAK